MSPATRLFCFSAPRGFPGLGTSGTSRGRSGTPTFGFRPAPAGRLSFPNLTKCCCARAISPRIIFMPLCKPVWKTQFLEEKLLGEKASVFQI